VVTRDKNDDVDDADVDKQAQPQTDTTENNATLLYAVDHRCAGGKQ